MFNLGVTSAMCLAAIQSVFNLNYIIAALFNIYIYMHVHWGSVCGNKCATILKVKFVVAMCAPTRVPVAPNKFSVNPHSVNRIPYLIPP